MMNCEQAMKVAGWLTRSPAPPQHLAQAVAAIRSATNQAQDIAAEVSGMTAVAIPRILVVDRVTWARGAVAAIDAMVKPSFAQDEPGIVREWTNALELGSAVALISGRVLGQYDPMKNRLFMVAPNLIAADSAGADSGFWLWVAVHEYTHALQFASAPWLKDVLIENAGRLIKELRQPVIGRLGIPKQSRENVPPMLRVMLGEQALEVLDQVTGIMALLEGHADVTMDAISKALLPQVVQLRTAFEQRRESGGLWSVVLRKVLGMDAKVAQYRQGARFVRQVTEQAGAAGFAKVWKERALLPTWQEITDPAAWMARAL